MASVVYKNKTHHLTTPEVRAEVRDAAGVREISDAAAQTIASWFHSPGSPNSTRLSTMGEVTDDMTLADFYSQQEYEAMPAADRDAVSALGTWILSKQKG